MECRSRSIKWQSRNQFVYANSAAGEMNGRPCCYGPGNVVRGTELSGLVIEMISFNSSALGKSRVERIQNIKSPLVEYLISPPEDLFEAAGLAGTVFTHFSTVYIHANI